MVLVDGRIVGVWEHIIKRDNVVVNLTLFDASAQQFEAVIAAEVARLGKFLGSDASLEING